MPGERSACPPPCRKQLQTPSSVPRQAAEEDEDREVFLFITVGESQGRWHQAPICVIVGWTLWSFWSRRDLYWTLTMVVWHVGDDEQWWHTETQVSCCTVNTLNDVQSGPHWTFPKFKSTPFHSIQHLSWDGISIRNWTFAHQAEMLKYRPSAMHHLLPLTHLGISFIPDSSESSSHTSSKS